HAFSESDVRLLETLANSMSVALENARLFDKTQLLLKETEQRATELAIINSVQKGLAEQLDIQSIYDLVGDKLYEVFLCECVQIVIYDPMTNKSYSPYCIERGDRHTHALGEPRGFFKRVIETGRVLWLNEITEQTRLEYASGAPPTGRQPVTSIV